MIPTHSSDSEIPRTLRHHRTEITESLSEDSAQGRGSVRRGIGDRVEVNARILRADS